MINHLSAYHKKIEKSFIKNYHKTKKSYSVEGIHKMRLSIKRLRAFLKILGNFDKQSGSKKFLKNINLLFKHSGELRDLQVQSALLEHYRNEAGADFDSYLDQINSKKKNAGKTLKKSFKKIEVHEIAKIGKNIEQSLSGFQHKNFNEEYSLLAEKKLTEIRDLIVAINDDSVLHLVRRRMKEILFMQEIVTSEENIRLLDDETLQFLSDMEIKLGEWHDSKVLLDNFLGFEHKGVSYRDVLDRIEKNKLQRQEEIAEKLRLFFYLCQ